MKTTLLILLVIPFLGTVSSSNNAVKCDHEVQMTREWITMTKDCGNITRDQVQKELNAAMTYLAMGSYFSRYEVNRPGFAKFFFESASEERGHAIKIISYLLMRTDPVYDLKHLINDPEPKDRKLEWKNGAEALEDALILEAEVTESIRSIIKKCEEAKDGTGVTFNDYHLVDYLSGDFLEEQYKGQRQLAGMVSTLKKMESSQGVLGEYLFDKKLLNNELF